jgi:AcrR family transcriptional regulator
MLVVVNSSVYTPGVTEGMTSATRRAEILSAAAELFAARGYHGVSIGDLGRAVGLTGPALYRHFRGKEALLAEMLLDVSERLLTEGRRSVSEAASPADALDALLRWHIEFALGDPALITVHERELDTVPEPQRREIRRLQRAYVEEWVEVLRRVYPGSSADHARAAAHAVFGLLNSSPRSAGSLGREAMTPLLHAMAAQAFGAAFGSTGARRGPT